MINFQDSHKTKKILVIVVAVLFLGFVSAAIISQTPYGNVLNLAQLAATDSEYGGGTYGGGVYGGEDPADTDSDGVPDTTDNCINNSNADQADADSDGIGDVCDSTPTGETSGGGGSSGGGGGGGSSSSGGGGGSSSNTYTDEITISSANFDSGIITINGVLNEGSQVDLYAVFSTVDSTPDCSNGGSQYIKPTFSGKYSENDSYNVAASGFTSGLTYYAVMCADDGGDKLESKVFTVSSAGSNIPTPTPTPSPTPTSANVDSTIPVSFAFENNISYVQPQINISTDVRYLEQFLNDFEGENLPVDGIYSFSDNEAVKRFQLKYKREILDVWDLTGATGFVGITTRLKLNFLLKGQTAVCPAFTEYNGGLSGIMFSPEIGKTQVILRDLDMYFGPINNTWDVATNQALITFQETFREVMLDPWNIYEGTGYKYKTTNKFLNYFAGCDTGSVYLEGVGTYEGL